MGRPPDSSGKSTRPRRTVAPVDLRLTEALWAKLARMCEEREMALGPLCSELIEVAVISLTTKADADPWRREGSATEDAHPVGIDGDASAGNPLKENT